MVVDVAEKYHDCDTASLLQMIGTFFVAPWKTAVRSLNREKMHQMDQENAIELTGIADMLIKLTQFNDRIPLASSNLTRFHSRQIPPITVAEYLQRCVKYAALERTTLIMLLVYIDRVCERHRMFVISSLTVHRFVIAALTVAAKQLCDSFCTNVHYARVGGISLRELNTLELEFLFLIDWRLSVGSAELQQYYVNLVRQSGSFNVKPGMVGDTILLCGFVEDRPFQKDTTLPNVASKAVAERPVKAVQKDDVQKDDSQKDDSQKDDVSTSGSSSSGQSSGNATTPSPRNQLIHDTQRMSIRMADSSGSL